MGNLITVIIVTMISVVSGVQFNEEVVITPPQNTQTIEMNYEPRKEEKPLHSALKTSEEDVVNTWEDVQKPTTVEPTVEAPTQPDPYGFNRLLIRWA